LHDSHARDAGATTLETPVAGAISFPSAPAGRAYG